MLNSAEEPNEQRCGKAEAIFSHLHFARRHIPGQVGPVSHIGTFQCIKHQFYYAKNLYGTLHLVCGFRKSQQFVRCSRIHDEMYKCCIEDI